MHKISSGDGYLYLVRQVAASDATHRGRSTLSDYYSVKGEAPGGGEWAWRGYWWVWLGSGGPGGVAVRDFGGEWWV
ncbi:hypothetical protein A5637_18795 [Mycolicibacterium fortuitum]|nr:hypothetical protein A5637_18795 [Mycolicibacterium fortuitum]